MGCAASSQPLPEQPGRAVGEADASHASLGGVPKRLEELQGQLASMAQSIAQLTQQTGELQRENNAYRIANHSKPGSNLRAASPSQRSSRRISGAGVLGASETNPAWPTADDEGTLCPPGLVPGIAAGGQSARSSKVSELTSVLTAVARLETQMTDLTIRMGRTEGALRDMQVMKEAWETQRAAEEFAKQLRKLEEVGIPTHSRRGSNLPSGTSTAAMSFSDDLPALDGLPQMRYPRPTASTTQSRHASTRRSNTEGPAPGSSGGGVRSSGRTSRQTAASGGGAAGVSNGGGGPPGRGGIAMLPISESGDERGQSGPQGPTVTHQLPSSRLGAVGLGDVASPLGLPSPCSSTHSVWAASVPEGSPLSPVPPPGGSPVANAVLNSACRPIPPHDHAMGSQLRQATAGNGVRTAF